MKLIREGCEAAKEYAIRQARALNATHWVLFLHNSYWVTSDDEIACNGLVFTADPDSL